MEKLDTSYSSKSHIDQLKRLPRREWPALTELLLPALALCSSLLLGLAAPTLTGAEGVTGLIKCILLAAAGGLVSYGINRLAVERGAYQAAIGSIAALIASIGSILSIGFGIFTASFAGLTLPETDALSLERYGNNQAQIIALHSIEANEALRILPALTAHAAELDELATCEAATSCFSGQGDGGKGAYSRAFAGAAKRAKLVLAEVQATASRASGASDQLTQLQGAFTGVVADPELTPEARRQEAAALRAEIAATLATLDAADPDPLVRAYAQGLGARDDDTVPARFARFLADQGAQLLGVLGARPAGTAPLPDFPLRAGVADALGFVLHFLPLALLVAVVELVFPITLWAYAYIALSARVTRDEAQSDRNAPTGAAIPREDIPHEAAKDDPERAAAAAPAQPERTKPAAPKPARGRKRAARSKNR